MRECGLKQGANDVYTDVDKVTPHAGVWIETDVPCCAHLKR